MHQPVSVGSSPVEDAEALGAVVVPRQIGEPTPYDFLDDLARLEGTPHGNPVRLLLGHDEHGRGEVVEVWFTLAEEPAG